MNPFRPNQPEHVTEQDLFALHLNELPPARAHALRRIIAQDPALAAESASIAGVLAAVTLNATASQPSPTLLDTAILDRNWQGIRPGLGSHTPIPTRWQLPAFAAGVLAAAAGVVLIAYTHHPGAPGFTQSKGSNQTANQNQLPPASSHSPMLTASPHGQADLQPREPGFRANFTSGVYHPKSHSPNAPIHVIGLAHQPLPVSAAVEPLRQLPLTLLPTPRLTQEPQPSMLAANPAQDHPQLQSEPSETIISAKPVTHLPGKPRYLHQLDVMLGVGGTLIPEHDSLSANNELHTLAVTHAIVAIGSLHQQLRPALGYRVTLSYTRPGFGYTYSALGNGTTGTIFYGGSSISSRIFEAAGTYVFQGPHYKHLTTSADAGGAFLAFLPSNSADPSTSYGYRGAGVLGVNVDYAITKHIGARLGHRAKLFRSPDFSYSGANIPVTTPLIIDNEPSLGVTYTFGKR